MVPAPSLQRASAHHAVAAGGGTVGFELLDVLGGEHRRPPLLLVRWSRSVSVSALGSDWVRRNRKAAGLSRRPLWSFPRSSVRYGVPLRPSVCGGCSARWRPRRVAGLPWSRHLLPCRRRRTRGRRRTDRSATRRRAAPATGMRCPSAWLPVVRSIEVAPGRGRQDAHPWRCGMAPHPDGWRQRHYHFSRPASQVAGRRLNTVLAVVPELLDRLPDVVEGPVAAVLLGPTLEHVGVPAPGQLLDRRHVDGAVVQVVLDLGQVAGEEAAVGADRVAAQRHRPGVGHVLLDERQRLGAGLLQRDRRASISGSSPDLVCMSRTNVVHRPPSPRAAGGRRGRALGDDLEVVVGDERGDLDDDVALGSSPVISRSIHTSTGRAKVAGVLDVPVVAPRPRPPAARLRPARRRRRRPRRPGGRACSRPAAGGPLVPTGIAVAIPEGYAGFVQPRSGLPLRHGVTCLNTPGLVDAGYRGELKVVLVNTDPVDALRGPPGRPHRPARDPAGRTAPPSRRSTTCPTARRGARCRLSAPTGHD